MVPPMFRSAEARWITMCEVARALPRSARHIRHGLLNDARIPAVLCAALGATSERLNAK